MSGFGLSDEVRHVQNDADRSIADMLRGMSYADVSKIRDSVIAQEYARANRLVISSTCGMRTTRYGFRDLKTGVVVLVTWPDGVSSYSALYRAMKRYVATGFAL